MNDCVIHAKNRRAGRRSNAASSDFFPLRNRRTSTTTNSGLRLNTDFNSIKIDSLSLFVFRERQERFFYFCSFHGVYEIQVNRLNMINTFIEIKYAANRNLSCMMDRKIEISSARSIYRNDTSLQCIVNICMYTSNYLFVESDRFGYYCNDCCMCQTQITLGDHIAIIAEHFINMKIHVNS